MFDYSFHLHWRFTLVENASVGPSAGDQQNHESLDETHHASGPPAARHDDPANPPASVVVVGPRPVAPERLTHPLTMAVTAMTFSAANTTMVQHGIEHHVPLRTLLIPLERERREESPVHSVLVLKACVRLYVL